MGNHERVECKENIKGKLLEEEITVELRAKERWSLD